MMDLNVAPQDCKDCFLHNERTNVVNYDGDPYSPLAFVGEGPGREEDESGKPFVGRAGKKLTKCLRMLRVTRDMILIFNIVKCRPPNNRRPMSYEVKACEKYLIKQFIRSKNLKVIMALGRTSWTNLTGEDIPVIANRGKDVKIGKYTYIYTYHPSYIARKNNIGITKEFLSDIKKGIKLSGLRRKK